MIGIGLNTCLFGGINEAGINPTGHLIDLEKNKERSLVSLLKFDVSNYQTVYHSPLIDHSDQQGG